MNKWRKKHDVKFGKIRFGETLTVAKKTKGDARNLETTVRNCGPFPRVAYNFLGAGKQPYFLGHPFISYAVTTLILGPLDGSKFFHVDPKDGHAQIQILETWPRKTREWSNGVRRYWQRGNGHDIATTSA